MTKHPAPTTPTPAAILSTITSALQGLELRIKATKPEDITKLEKHTQQFAIAMAALNALPEKERATLITKLAPYRVQIEHAYDVILTQHGNLRQDIMGVLKNVEAQKNYAQYTQSKKK